MTEKMRDDAIREAARNAAVDEYFKARPQLMRTRHEECLVEAGFDRAWQAAQDEQSVQVVGEAVENAAKSIASMVDEWVHGCIKNNGNWQESLPALIHLRLKRYWPSTSITAAELERLRVAARALKALLARDLTYADNIVYFPFESSTQAFNHILDARDAAIAAEGEKE